MPATGRLTCRRKRCASDGGAEVAFEIDHEIRRRLLAGLDDIGVTLSEESEISSFESERQRSGPVTTAL